MIDSRHRQISIWLTFTCIVILGMVIVGGVTRLTDSGLSIVDWRPLLGTIPPLTDSAWQEKFIQYQQFPEYILEKSHMTLSEFKFIYFWEFFHRLLGRFIGMIYFIPFMFFLLKGNMTSNLKVKLSIGMGLGAAQGLMGWYMVKSGLIDRPDVSHFRLAAHFGLALLILSYLYWIILELKYKSASRIVTNAVVKSLTIALLIILSFQIVYGAFVAGLDAGIGYNTFPLMNGQWFPKQLLFMKPLWSNFVENPAAVQFVHRTMGWIVAMCALVLYWKSRKAAISTSIQTAVKWVLGFVVVQFCLGVATLVLKVPLVLAVSHQLGACFLLLAAVRLYFLQSKTYYKSII